MHKPQLGRKGDWVDRHGRVSVLIPTKKVAETEVLRLSKGTGKAMESKPSSISEKVVPVPPPLPNHSKIGFHQNRRLGNNGFPNIGCCLPSTVAVSHKWDRLFDEGYRADVLIHTEDDGIIYAHASILGIASPVFKGILKETRTHRRGQPRSISIRGVPPKAVQVFIRYLYTSCYGEDKSEEHALHLLVLSHVYAIPSLKRLCEWWIEHGLLTAETVVDLFQLALLCDAPRLSLICHRFILKNFKAVSATEGWKVMKDSHPVLEKEIMVSIIEEDSRTKDRTRKVAQRQIYQQLYEAMEAVVHIFQDGCRTIGPHDKVLKNDQSPCPYVACKVLESLVRHFAGCKKRVPGGCTHCKRMWKMLELHSRLCADPDVCRVPLCRNFRHRRRGENKKDEVKWRILVRNIVRSKSISGAPFFSLESR